MCSLHNSLRKCCKPGLGHFSHGGVNEGFESTFAAYRNTGDGAVVMTNAQGGTRLASELMASIAVEYHWSDFQPKVRTTVKVPSAALARYVGTYQVPSSFSLAFTLDGDHLIAQAGPIAFRCSPNPKRSSS